MTQTIRLRESSGRLVTPRSSTARLRESGAAPLAPKRSSADLERELVALYEGMGLTPRGAVFAARGREADDSGPSTAAGPVPTIKPKGYSASDYAIWDDQIGYYFPLTYTPGAKPDGNLVSSAVTGLLDPDTGAARGAAQDLSASQFAALKTKLSKAWDAAYDGWLFPPAKPKGLK